MINGIHMVEAINFVRGENDTNMVFMIKQTYNCEVFMPAKYSEIFFTLAYGCLFFLVFIFSLFSPEPDT